MTVIGKIIQDLWSWNEMVDTFENSGLVGVTWCIAMVCDW